MPVVGYAEPSRREENVVLQRLRLCLSFAAEAEAKEAKKAQQEKVAEAGAEMPANGGLFANAKISADALKKLTEDQEG